MLLSLLRAAGNKDLLRHGKIVEHRLPLPFHQDLHLVHFPSQPLEFGLYPSNLASIPSILASILASNLSILFPSFDSNLDRMM